jgi:hypothetical protein
MKLVKVITKGDIRIEDEHEIYLQSYDSIVARYDKEHGHITIGYDWDYSRTTIKAVKSFIHDYSSYRHTGKIREKTVEYFTIADLRRQLETGLVLLGIQISYDSGLQEAYEKANLHYGKGI